MAERLLCPRLCELGRRHRVDQRVLRNVLPAVAPHRRSGPDRTLDAFVEAHRHRLDRADTADILNAPPKPEETGEGRDGNNRVSDDWNVASDGQGARMVADDLRGARMWRTPPCVSAGALPDGLIGRVGGNRHALDGRDQDIDQRLGLGPELAAQRIETSLWRELATNGTSVIETVDEPDDRREQSRAVGVAQRRSGP